jgi:T1SS-143 domain-containing protein
VQDAFTYTLTDADGDSTTATLTITLADNRPVATTSAATVDDEGLAGGIVGGSGDLDANVGETTPSASEAIYNGTLGGSPGDGPTVFLFEASLTGTTASVGTETVEYTVSGGGTLLTATVDGGARDGIVLFTVQITNTTTGAYTLTLQDNVLHPSLDGVAGDNTENDASVVIPYQMMDTDGDLSLAAGQLTVTFDDDIPTATANQLTGTVDEDGVLEGAADNGAGDGIAGGTGDVAGQNVSATGSVTTLFNSGADSPLAYSLLNNFAALTAQGLTSGGTALSYSVGLVAGVYTLTATAGPGGYTVFTFTLNASTGAYNFTLVDQMDHLSGNNENDLTVNLSSIIQATDADGDSVGSGANGLIITVDDDSPIATATQLTGTVDEDGVVENVSVGIQKGDGVPGGTGDVAGEVVSATGNVGTLFQSGADEPLSYQMLNSFAALTAQGLTSGGTALSYSVQLAGGVYTLTATAGPGGNTVFTFTLNAATGAYNFTLVDQLDHPTLNGLTGDNTENDLAINLSSIIQATDFDGDSVGAGANGLVITVDDDMPVINSVTTPLQVDNDATPSATGNFDFDIGADENSDNDDIAVSNFTVSVNGVALDPSDFTLTPGVENATTASYTFTFDYDTGTGGETTATGTLVFDKVAGTYTVTLTNGPIEGFSLLATGSADASDFVSYQVPAGGSGSPEVTVAALDTDFFVQFSGVAEPGSGTGADNLTTTTGAGGAFVPVTTASFGGLELFTQAMASIVVSSTAAGVGGNTIQGGEVLDLNLYATDPGGTLGGVPTQTSTSMFVALDGIGGAEDMIVVLKLYDTVTGQYTTKAIIVQNADILVQADAASLVGTPYEGLGAALDNNDGLIVFEPNDYQEGNTNLVIVGAQIAGSDEGITGTGINLNGDVGVSGGSIGTQAFSTDVSDAPFKITSIGFLTTSSEDQSAQIGFDVTIEDYDGDALTQHIDVNIGSSSPALLPPDPQGFASTLSTESSSLLVSNDNERSGGPGNTGKNVGDTGIMAGIVAAAGLMSDAAAAQDAADSGSDQGSELAYSYTAQTVETISAGDDSDSSSVSPLAAEPQAEDSAPAQSSSSSDDQANSSHGVDKGSAPAASDASDHASSDDHGPAAAADNTSPVAPTVAMVSAEALEAAKAGVDANAQHGGSVEQIVADALGQGDAPTVDAALANLPGGNGELSALATIASPAGAAVSGWDMGGQGAIGTIHDMMLSMHAPGMHHDAVQPAVNG